MQVLLDLLRQPDRHPLAAARDATVSTSAAEMSAAESSLVALCQPTTPFRTADDVRATVQMAGRFDCAIAVMAAPVPPQRSFPVDASGECRIADDSPLRQGKTRKQVFEEMYTPNGAVYVATRRHVLEHGSFFAGRVGAHIMPRERSLDIDDEFDWQMAELLARRQW
jgi:CMP-N-acetylneuraminic acid synthetase